MRGVAVRIVAGLLGLVVGLASLLIAVSSPAYTLAGSPAGTALLLLAGGAAAGLGLLFWSTRPGVVGPALVAVGITWLIAEWDNPGVGSALVFTTGLVLQAAVPVVVAFVMFVHPAERLPGWPERLVLGALLVGPVFLLGFGATLFYDPLPAGCAGCANNVLLLDADSEVADGLGKLGIRVGAMGALAAVVVAAWRLARASAAKRFVTAPALLAGAVYLTAAGWAFVANRNRPFLASGPLERRLWYVQAVALLLVAVAVAFGAGATTGPARAWSTSSSSSAVSLLDIANPPVWREALRASRRSVGAGRVLDRRGAVANVDGEELALPTAGGPGATPLVCDGDGGDDPSSPRPARHVDLVAEVASTAGLLLETERLQAERRVTRRSSALTRSASSRPVTLTAPARA